MQFSTIGYEVDGPIARLTLQRPEVSNGFNIPMCEDWPVNLTWLRSPVPERPTTRP